MRLLLAFELLLECSKCVDITECGSGSLVLDYGSCIFLLGALLCSCSSLLLGTLSSLSYIFENAAVREDDALSVLIELDYLELELLVGLSL